MASGRINGPKTGEFSVDIAWESVPDYAQNCSQITAHVFINYNTIAISARAKAGQYLSIDGTQYNYTTPAIHDYTHVGSIQPYEVFTKTVTVSHDANGEKTVSLEAHFPFNLNNATLGYVGTLSVSGQAVLDTIPQESAVALSKQSLCIDGTQNITVTITPVAASLGYHHAVTFAFGDKIHTVTDETKLSHTFAPPMDWLESIPNASSGVASVRVQTKTTAGINVGSVVVKQFTVTVPESANPTLSVAYAGIDTLNGRYVQGKSRLKATLTAAGQYGATIASYAMTVQGVTTSSTTSNVLTSELLRQSGSVLLTVTDSRGRTAQQQQALTVYPYTPPTISSVNAVRDTDIPTTVQVTVASSVASLDGQNTKTVTVKIGSQQMELTGDSATFTNLDADTTFQVLVTVIDAYGAKATHTQVLPTVAVTMDFHNSGAGVAFGKVAETLGLLDSAWPIAEQGTTLVNKFAGKTHTHAPTDLTAAVPISKGGTGATTREAAIYALMHHAPTPDLNAALQTGLYAVGDTTLNKAAWGICLVLYRDANMTVQLNFNYYGNTMYIRVTKDGGSTWTDWQHVYTGKSLIYSASTPSSYSTGTIWLKPIE